jgi:hypothetical protein
MRLALVGESDLELEFLPGHQFGEGRTTILQNWHVRDERTGLALVLGNAEQDVYCFSPQADGRWSGRRLVAPRTDALLAPLDGTPPASDDNGLIADLIAASGLAAQWTQQAEAELTAALRLVNRMNPGVADRLRKYSALRCARNARLSETLCSIADILSAQQAESYVAIDRSKVEQMARWYVEAWRSP